MRRGLHPELAKRAILQNPDTGEQRFHHLTQQQMVEKTRQGGGSVETPSNKRYYDISVLDVYGGIASIRAESYDYIDYLHLALCEGRWLIVNVLWTENYTNK
jgi:hypothetical protein